MRFRHHPSEVCNKPSTILGGTALSFQPGKRVYLGLKSTEKQRHWFPPWSWEGKTSNLKMSLECWPQQAQGICRKVDLPVGLQVHPRFRDVMAERSQ